MPDPAVRYCDIIRMNVMNVEHKSIEVMERLLGWPDETKQSLLSNMKGKSSEHTDSN